MMDFKITPAELEILSLCPLCQSSNLHEISRLNDLFNTEFLATAMCHDCRFVFRSTRPTKRWFTDAFEKREAFQRNSGIDAINSDIEAERYERYFRLGKLLARLPAPSSQKRSILDVGCGPGTGLRGFADAGFEASGVEEDTTRASYGIKLGLRIAITPWEFFESEDRFDFITCLHSVEHFHDPMNLLCKLKGWLKPNGRIIIEVPNFRYFVQDWSDSLYLAHMANYSLAT